MNLSGATILVVDDQPGNLDVVGDFLEPEGYDLRMCRNGEQALALLQRLMPDLILLDIMMPGLDGFEVCQRIKADSKLKNVPVMFITARDDIADVVTGFEMGGVDYILKPIQKEELKVRVATQLRMRKLVVELTEEKEALKREIVQREALTEERDHLTHRLSLISEEETKRWGIDGFVGKSKTLQKILRDIARLQQSANTSVMITGESGTGKELVARAIHFGSGRAKGPFVPVNCSAVSYELADSLFFGHVKGAFTGADEDREGYFALADGGTLFLDEVGDMPLDLQTKLLRVLEARKVMPLGAMAEKNIDVRILAATNVDLNIGIKNGQFREDLYYRLASFPVQVPPLRERVEDIPLLVEHFLTFFGDEMGIGLPAISSEALEKLSDYAFPGNIRELKNIVERAFIESGGQEILPEHLHLGQVVARVETPPEEANIELPFNMKDAELVWIKRALAATNGNVAEAARLLGVNRSKIYRRLAKESRMDS